MKIAEPVHECIFERIKHQIAIVLASEYTLLSYLNVSSVIPWGQRHFYPANRFWENRKSLFIAEPRSDFNRCYEQQISENHNWILFITVSLWFWSVAKYKRPIFKDLNLFTIELAQMCWKSTAFDLAFHGRKLFVFLAYQQFLLHILILLRRKGKHWEPCTKVCFFPRLTDRSFFHTSAQTSLSLCF